jgi:hypothetical protein
MNRGNKVYVGLAAVALVAWLYINDNERSRQMAEDRATQATNKLDKANEENERLRERLNDSLCSICGDGIAGASDDPDKVAVALRKAQGKITSLENELDKLCKDPIKVALALKKAKREIEVLEYHVDELRYNPKAAGVAVNGAVWLYRNFRWTDLWEHNGDYEMKYSKFSNTFYDTRHSGAAHTSYITCKKEIKLNQIIKSETPLYEIAVYRSNGEDRKMVASWKNGTKSSLVKDIKSLPDGSEQTSIETTIDLEEGYNGVETFVKWEGNNWSRYDQGVTLYESPKAARKELKDSVDAGKMRVDDPEYLDVLKEIGNMEKAMIKN